MNEQWREANRHHQRPPRPPPPRTHSTLCTLCATAVVWHLLFSRRFSRFYCQPFYVKQKASQKPRVSCGGVPPHPPSPRPVPPTPPRTPHPLKQNSAQAFGSVECHYWALGTC